MASPWQAYTTPIWAQQQYVQPVYYPAQFYPGGQVMTGPNAWSMPPNFHINNIGNPKYPELNPAMTNDQTNLPLDARKPPMMQDIYPQSAYAHVAYQPVFGRTVTALKLISKDIPWSITITPNGGVVNCAAVWDAIYGTLQGYLSDSEFGMFAGDYDSRKRVMRAARRRNQAGDPDGRLKRIDFLGEDFVFSGLDLDPEFAKARSMPGQEQFQETWVMKFGRR